MQEFPVAVFELSGYSDSERKEAAYALSILSQDGSLSLSTENPNWAECTIEQLSESWMGNAWKRIASYGGTVAIQFYRSGVLVYGSEMVPYHKIQRAVETSLLYILLLKNQIAVLRKTGIIDGTDLAFRTFLEEQGVKTDTIEWFSAN